MSEFTVPSYRVRPERTGFRVPWRILAISGAVLGVASLGGAAVWGVSRAVNRSVPVIEADTRPIRVKPSDPGGMRVANQDERIFESQRRGATGTPAQTRLSPEAERPDVAALRQAAAARPAPVATPAPTVTPTAPIATLPAPQPDAQPSRQALVNPSLVPQPAPRPGVAQAPVANPVQQGGTAQPMIAPQPGTVGVPPTGAPAAQAAVAAQATPAITPPPMPATAATPTTAAAPARPVRTGRVVVQLGALATEEAARAEWPKLQARLPDLAGREPQITRVDRGDQPPLWRIRATNMPDAGAARALCESARAKSLPCAVIGG